MDSEIRTILNQLAERRDLSCDQARHAFDRIMAGEIDSPNIEALLRALLAKGECIDEIAGAAQAMRTSAVRIACDRDCVDTCGTGGDGISTYNVSTTAAVIAAAAGATVAKHGNRSTTRASGSTEVLTELGIDVDAEQSVVERCLAETRIGFLNARLWHPAMRFAAPARQAIHARTIFNLLGPLTNPAGARRQVLGVPRLDLLDTMATVLKELGTLHSWVVHGDGLCDLTVTGVTHVVEIRDGRIDRFEVAPEDVGLERGTLDDLRIASAGQSARIVEAILQGKNGVPRDHALMNAGAALVVAGLATDLRGGVDRAAQAVDSGEALKTLERWRSIAGASAGNTR